MRLTWFVFYVKTELARNWNSQRFQKSFIFSILSSASEQNFKVMGKRSAKVI